MTTSVWLSLYSWEGDCAAAVRREEVARQQLSDHGFPGPLFQHASDSHWGHLSCHLSQGYPHAGEHPQEGHQGNTTHLL